jgi:hypothetical protein
VEVPVNDNLAYSTAVQITRVKSFIAEASGQGENFQVMDQF